MPITPTKINNYLMSIHIQIALIISKTLSLENVQLWTMNKKDEAVLPTIS